MYAISSIKTIFIIPIFLIFSFGFFAKDKIYILPLEEQKEDIIMYLKDNLSKIFSLDIEVLESKRIPLSSYNPKRKQYNSTLILKELLKNGLKGYTLVVCDVDLYTEGLNFVFGEASFLNKICIISLTRLREEYYGLIKNDNLFLERALKEAVHELGHVFGLRHCANPKCVMYFSNSITDTDIKTFNFCALCKEKLKNVNR